MKFNIAVCFVLSMVLATLFVGKAQAETEWLFVVECQHWENKNAPTYKIWASRTTTAPRNQMAFVSTKLNIEESRKYLDLYTQEEVVFRVDDRFDTLWRANVQVNRYPSGSIAASASKLDERYSPEPLKLLNFRMGVDGSARLSMSGSVHKNLQLSDVPLKCTEIQ